MKLRSREMNCVCAKLTTQIERSHESIKRMNTNLTTDSEKKVEFKSHIIIEIQT